MVTDDAQYSEGSEHFDPNGIRSRLINGVWVRVDGQTWRDPQTNKIYTWLKDRWVRTTDLERVKRIIEHLRWLIPAELIIPIEDWVREQGGYDG